MDKLNRKGFTLVELLAVIVILAIIIALVFPQVSSVMNSSKVSAVHSQSKTIVSSWAQMIVEDGMQPEENWQISSELKEEVYNSSNNDYFFKHTKIIVVPFNKQRKRINKYVLQFL